MRTSLTVALIAFVACSAAACRRNTGPSPEYVEASGLYDRVRVDLGDDAYSDPRMTEVEGLLRKVHPESVDAPAAKELLSTIASERQRIAQEAAAAQSAAPDDATAEPEFDEEPPEEEAATAAEPEDAGFSQPEQGMTVAAFEAKFSRCFEAGPQLMLSGVGLRSTYQLKDISNCRDRHGDFAPLVLLIDNGRIAGFAQKSAMELRLPDGGVPRERPAQQGPGPQPEPAEQTPPQPAAPPADYDSIKY